MHVSIYDIYIFDICGFLGHARIIGLLTVLDAKIMMMIVSRTTQSLSKQSDSLNLCFFCLFVWLSILSRKTLNLAVCAYFKAYDQKNIRRRVYDALNVLMAMNIISKEKKEIKWVGLPTNSAQECQQLEVCVEELTLCLKLDMFAYSKKKNHKVIV